MIKNLSNAGAVNPTFILPMLKFKKNKWISFDSFKIFKIFYYYLIFKDFYIAKSLFVWHLCN